MRKLKVYISKSKQGKIDDLLLLRKDLSRFNLEIVEFSGGEYSDKLLKSSDLLIVLLPNSDSNFIGKGQYTEFYNFEKTYNSEHDFSNDYSPVTYFAKNKHGEINYYVNDCVDTDSLEDVCLVKNINWTDSYAEINLDNTSEYGWSSELLLNNFLEDYDPDQSFIESLNLSKDLNYSFFDSPSLKIVEYSKCQEKTSSLLACLSLFPNLKIC